MKSELIKPTIALIAVTVIAAFIIGLTFVFTEEPITEQRARAELEAVLLLFPQTYDTLDFEISIEGLSLNRGIKSFDNNGDLVGYVFSASPAGYSGAINMMVAIDTSGSIQGVQIVRHTETPGLGSNITNESFTNSFVGRSGVIAYDIPVIASATISVNAVVRGINDAVLYFEEELISP